MQLVEDYCATICTFTNGNVYHCAKIKSTPSDVISAAFFHTFQFVYLITVGQVNIKWLKAAQNKQGKNYYFFTRLFDRKVVC